MSFDKLKEIASADSRGASTQSNTPGRNVALNVTSFDIPANQTVGFDLLTGSEMRISLRPDKVKRTYERADVPAWSGTGKGGTRNKSYTEIGGTILFESVFEYPDGLTARWGTAVSHTPTEATVFIEPARPFVSKKDSYGIEVIHTQRSKMVSTIDELRAALIDALPNQYSAAIVRFGQTMDDGSKEVITARDGRNIISRSISENNAYKAIEADEAADRFMQTEYGQYLASDIGTDFITEVIPVERYFAGKDTRQMLGDKDKFQRYYKMDGDIVGFTPSIITLRRHAEGGQYMSAEPIPTSTKPKIYPLDKVPTSILIPDESLVENHDSYFTKDHSTSLNTGNTDLPLTQDHEIRTSSQGPMSSAREHIQYDQSQPTYAESSPVTAIPQSNDEPPPRRRGFGDR